MSDAGGQSDGGGGGQEGGAAGDSNGATPAGSASFELELEFAVAQSSKPRQLTKRAGRGQASGNPGPPGMAGTGRRRLFTVFFQSRNQRHLKIKNYDVTHLFR